MYGCKWRMHGCNLQSNKKYNRRQELKSELIIVTGGVKGNLENDIKLLGQNIGVAMKRKEKVGVAWMLRLFFTPPKI